MRVRVPPAAPMKYYCIHLEPNGCIYVIHDKQPTKKQVLDLLTKNGWVFIVSAIKSKQNRYQDIVTIEEIEFATIT